MKIRTDDLFHILGCHIEEIGLVNFLRDMKINPHVAEYDDAFYYSYPTYGIELEFDKPDD